MENQQEVNGNIPDNAMVMSEEQVEQYKRELEEEKKKYPYISRNDYLKSLPKDEHGYPIVDNSPGGMFSKLAGIWGWEQDFLDDAMQYGLLEAEALPEYFQITEEEYGF